MQVIVTPLAPKFTKISLTNDGALLNWEPEINGTQCEYTVFMAVQFEDTKPIASKGKDHTYAAAASSSKLDFVRVFKGTEAQCLISHSKLAFSLRNSEKPIYIFRISVKNEIGHGPTTQVKWIKSSDTTITKNVGVKREGDFEHRVPVSKKLKVSKKDVQ